MFVGLEPSVVSEANDLRRLCRSAVLARMKHQRRAKRCLLGFGARSDRRFRRWPRGRRHQRLVRAAPEAEDGRLAVQPARLERQHNILEVFPKAGKQGQEKTRRPDDARSPRSPREETTESMTPELGTARAKNASAAAVLARKAQKSADGKQT